MPRTSDPSATAALVRQWVEAQRQKGIRKAFRDFQLAMAQRETLAPIVVPEMSFNWNYPFALTASHLSIRDPIAV